MGFFGSYTHQNLKLYKNHESSFVEEYAQAKTIERISFYNFDFMKEIKSLLELPS